MNTSRFSKILLDKTPKQINNIVEKVLDILFDINEVVRELNSIDFCNPLGYILTKSLPPDGIVDQKLKNYGKKITGFITKVNTKIDNNSNTDELANDIEEIRLLLEDIIPDEQLKDIIPGGDGILKTIQTLNDSLVITNTALTLKDKKNLIKSFSNKLIPLTNPVSLTEVLLSSQVDKLNKTLKNIIKPERFRSDLYKLIRLVIQIDKYISKINSIVILINKIIKSINVLIKITKLTIKILKKIPMPAKYVTVGMTVTSSSKVSSLELNLNELEKLLNAVSIFLSTSVIKQIQRIRNEIFILLIGLNQLYENLSACDIFENDPILNDIQNSIQSLNNNINTLEELFPSIKEENGINSFYKGFKILIVNEETTDNNTNLFRRRVIVTNSQDIIEYEGTPTYSNKDQILIKEGQFYIDSKSEYNTQDNGKNNITDEETKILLKQIGMESNSIEAATQKENEVNQKLYNQIQQNPDDKQLYNSLNGDNINPNPIRVEQVKKIISVLTKKQIDAKLLQVRLVNMSRSLKEKGYTPEEIQEGLKYQYKDKYSIQIINNNIQIFKK